MIYAFISSFIEIYCIKYYIRNGLHENKKTSIIDAYELNGLRHIK